jgi:transposase
MRAYSVDWRAKVLRAVDQGYARKEIVKLLGLSPASIKRYLRTAARNWRDGPHTPPGWPPKKLGPLQFVAMIRI